MIKLALFGDSAVQHYVVADRLWELISIVVDKKIKFAIVPLGTPTEALAAFEVFQKDKTFVGFNIAPVPWDGLIAERADTLEGAPTTINTVYKTADGAVAAANTYPLAAQRALEAEANLYKCRTVLVIGAKGAGLSIARHFFTTLDKEVYLYDAFSDSDKAPVLDGIQYISSLGEVAERQYDVIINTTPLGRYYFDKRVDAFTSPLDLETLSQIAHKATIVQEMNYLPGNTLLLQMARHLHIQVVMGSLALVFEAAESLRRYFGVTLSENTIRMLVDEISIHIADREAEILEQGSES